MLFYVLLACFLPMITTDAQTVWKTIDQETTTMQQNPEKQVHTGVINQPTAAALEAVSTTESESPSQYTLNQTIKPTTDKNDNQSPRVNDSREITNSGVQNGEIVSTTISSMQATPTTILSASSAFVIPIQTSKSETQTESVVTTNLSPTSKFASSMLTSSSKTQTESALMTDGPLKLTTQVAPTAKLSATTEMTSAKLTTKLENTTDFGAQTSKTQLTTNAKITTKLEKTSKATLVVTNEYRTISSNTAKEADKEAVNHGKIVAGIIGGSLIAMMIGFLVILYKKHKLKKHQIATTDWAGPTPFLDTGGENNGHVTLRSANRISLASFLPQRLSKRLTLLAETGEEMQDMHDLTTPTTFGGKEEKKVEKNGTHVDKTITSAKEAVVNKSEIPTKAENVVLINEVNKNGEMIKNKEDQIGQANNEKGENGASENAPAQPPEAENPPQQSNNENKEETGEKGTDSVV